MRYVIYKQPLSLYSTVWTKRARTFINFQTFLQGAWTLFQTKGLNFFWKSIFFGGNKIHMLQKLLYFSIEGQFSRGHVYFFCQMFQGLFIPGGMFIPDPRVDLFYIGLIQ